MQFVQTTRQRIGVGLTCWGAVAGFCAWVIGQWWRDASWLTGLCFYLPSPLLAAAILVAALVAGRSSRRLALGMLLLACGPVVFVANVENQWTRPPVELGTGHSRRLVHWNAFNGKLGWDGILAQLQSWHADAFVLSEVTDELNLSDAATSLGPNYSGLRLGDLAMLARGEISERQQRSEGAARAYLVDWRHGGDRFSVLIVDLPSSIWIARRPLLEWTVATMVELQPDLVVGDFNAPRRSTTLSALPGGYRHAYDLAGAGWSSTWPVPLPCWAIDQCIVSPRLQPYRYELHSTTLSDHRLQVFDFQLRPTAWASTARRMASIPVSACYNEAHE
jgi:vancomycin resistance protein VanJ